MVGPLTVKTPGEMGVARDLMARVAQAERATAEVRSTALTKQEIPPPVVLPPDPARGAMTRRLSTGTVATGGWVLMSWQNDATTGTAVTSPAASDLRAEVSGLYVYSTQVTLGFGGAANGREIRMLRDGIEDDKAIIPTDDNISLQLGRAIHLDAGDVLSIEVSHGAGITLGLSGGASSWFTLALIRED